MCTHRSSCPADDSAAARVSASVVSAAGVSAAGAVAVHLVAAHPEQGWCVDCTS